MIALIKLETQAMNTARLSARSIKLRPKANGLEIRIVLPVMTSGISFKERIKEDKMNRKESMFLRRLDILPAKGRQSEPTTGIKIILKTKLL